MGYDATRERGLGDNLIDVVVCLCTFCLVDREVRYAEAQADPTHADRDRQAGDDRW